MNNLTHEETDAALQIVAKYVAKRRNVPPEVNVALGSLLENLTFEPNPTTQKIVDAAVRYLTPKGTIQ